MSRAPNVQRAQRLDRSPPLDGTSSLDIPSLYTIGRPLISRQVGTNIEGLFINGPLKNPMNPCANSPSLQHGDAENGPLRQPMNPYANPRNLQQSDAGNGPLRQPMSPYANSRNLQQSNAGDTIGMGSDNKHLQRFSHCSCPLWKSNLAKVALVTSTHATAGLSLPSGCMRQMVLQTTGFTLTNQVS